MAYERGVIESERPKRAQRPRPAWPAQAGEVELRVGYVRLVDAAPLFVAQDCGFFRKRGLRVALSREVGWATVGEKVAFGELDAAQALCPMPLAAAAARQPGAVPCVTGLVLSRGGNAIVLSEELWKRGARDAEGLRRDIASRRGSREYVFASAHTASSHAFLLRQWLRSGGVCPDGDVRLIALPPSQMPRNLAAGTIDGFCAGEPWPSLAIRDGIGWSPAASPDIAPGHPEKTFMVRESFAERERETHLALLAALLEACAFCDRPKNRDAVARACAQRHRLDCDRALAHQALARQFDYGMGRREETPGFLYFSRDAANELSDADADWALRGLKDAVPSLAADLEQPGILRRAYRNDIYKEALKLASPPAANSFSYLSKFHENAQQNRPSAAARR